MCHLLPFCSRKKNTGQPLFEPFMRWQQTDPHRSVSRWRAGTHLSNLKWEPRRNGWRSGIFKRCSLEKTDSNELYAGYYYFQIRLYAHQNRIIIFVARRSHYIRDSLFRARKRDQRKRPAGRSSSSSVICIFPPCARYVRRRAPSSWPEFCFASLDGGRLDSTGWRRRWSGREEQSAVAKVARAVGRPVNFIVSGAVGGGRARSTVLIFEGFAAYVPAPWPAKRSASEWISPPR